MCQNIELIEALKTSLQMEETGRKFYLEVAENSSNDMSKKVFNALAEDELRHAEAIKKFAETPDLKSAMPEHQNIEDRLLFGQRAKDRMKEINTSDDELKAYETAMKLETDGYNFYKKYYENLSDANARELFNFLLTEESTHYKILQDTYQYLKNPKDWFSEQEKPIIEG